ncbi:hypothetical protein, partial [Pseudomonas viridiflava]|uniref:hypothetical protein n=1 Tax=Pseudomonas viridiflava TaxID=33069 RepID=UPI00197F1A58
LDASSIGLLLLSLSTIAGAKISNPSWVNFQSAGWVSFQSAPTRLGDGRHYVPPEIHATEKVTLEAGLKRNAFSAESKHSREAARRRFHAAGNGKRVLVAAIAIHNRPSCTYYLVSIASIEGVIIR